MIQRKEIQSCSKAQISAQVPCRIRDTRIWQDRVRWVFHGSRPEKSENKMRVSEMDSELRGFEQS